MCFRDCRCRKRGDRYCFQRYYLDNFRSLGGPPLVSTESRLIAAVVQNQVPVLRNLLDSPKWYNTTDATGHSLLQIAILCRREEVFYYMLSIPNFPLDFINRSGGSALALTFGPLANTMMGNFSAELVKKGACLQQQIIYHAPLHSAVMRSYRNTIRQLIEKGVDVNRCCCYSDCSPLNLAIERYDNDEEVILMLLMAGAEPSITDFERAVIYNCSPVVVETFYLYLCDQFSFPTTSLHALVVLADKHKDIFNDLVRHSVRAWVNSSTADRVFEILFFLHTNELKLILERFGPAVEELCSCLRVCSFNGRRSFSLDNLNLLIQYHPWFDFVNYISFEVRDTYLVFDIYDNVVQKLCFLLSYNLKATLEDVKGVYRRWGYSDLFKILLHMDVDYNNCAIFGEYSRGNFMPVLAHNVTIDADRFFLRYVGDGYIFDDLAEDPLDYFVHPQLVKLHWARVKGGQIQERKNIPKVPKLVEMARNEFRKYFVKRLDLQTASQFYTRLDRLPICELHKKIISYEAKLY